MVAETFAWRLLPRADAAGALRSAQTWLHTIEGITVPERKFVTKIRVRYHDPKWRWQQLVRMFTPRFLLFRIVFHVFDAGYRVIGSYCFYVIPESVIEFDKTAVN